MANIKVVAGTKGGVGKSVIAQNIMGIYYPKHKIYEVDNNNISQFNTVENYTAKKAEIVIDKLDLSMFKDKETISIVDVGGGDDTVSFLEKLGEESIECDFFIPVNQDYSQFKNIKDTLDLIDKLERKGSVSLILNRCHDIEEYKKEFYNIFGRKEYGIENRFPLIQKRIKHIIVIPETPIFSILEGKYQITFREALIWAEDLLKNADKYKEEWHKQGDDVFFQNKDKIRFAKKVVLLKEYLLTFKKEFQDG